MWRGLFSGTKVRRQQSQRRQKFLQGLSLERLESRQLLYGVTDTPHGAAPGHDLGDTITADVLIYTNGSLVDLPANLGVTSGEDSAFVRTSAAGSTVTISPADINGDSETDTPTEYVTLGDIFETWRTSAGDAGNNAAATFSTSELMGNTTDQTNALRMYVNGTPVHSYDAYEIHDNDRIVLTYGSADVIALNSNYGTLIFEMLPEAAPNTVTNFLNYVSDGDYQDSIIHRSVPGFVIQGGGFTTPTTTMTATSQFSPVPTDSPVVNEFDISNTRGTVAMAKLGGDPDSATSQWFVNLADNSANLDAQNGGFTVFANILDMASADAIASLGRQNFGGAFSDLPVASGSQLVAFTDVIADASVSGRVYIDADEDGNFDSGTESGLAGFTVYSDADGDNVLDADEFSVQTASDGTYFLRLPMGLHELKQVTPDPYKQITPSDPPHINLDLSVGQQLTSADFGNRIVEAPVSVDLIASSDSGSDSSDNITNHNNVSLLTALSFSVSGVEDGALVRLFAGTNEIGSATASASQVEITTAGNLRLDDGDLEITATQISEGVESLPSAPLSITIDSSVGTFEAGLTETITLAQDYSFNVNNAEEGDSGFGYEVIDGPEGLTVHPTTGFLQWRPNANQLGQNTFTVRATDIAGNTRDLVASLDVDGDALVEYSLELTDTDGNEISSVTVGDDFVLRVLVEDLRETPRGAFAAYLDVVWSDNRVEVTGPLTYGTAFPNVHTGVTSEDNIIDEAGGTGGFNELGGGEFLVFSVPMRAVTAGNATISADAADNSPHTDTLLFGINSAVDSDLIIYNSAEFQVGLGFSPTDDAYNFDEDTAGHTLNVLANDGDSADSLTISSVSTPSNGGTVTIATDGKSVEYTPAADFFGEDVFTYTAGDQSGSSQATVTVQVFPVQDPPIANEDIISSVNEDDVNILLDLMSNDSIAPDTGETLQIVAVTQGAEAGAVSISGNGLHVLYTPDTDFVGTDTFTYTIEDSNGGQATGNVTVNVQAVNDPPSAAGDAFTVDEDTIDVELNVLANDTSQPDEGETLSIVAVSTPTNGGVVTISSDNNNLLYSPAPDYIGNESFTYTLSDGNGGSSQANVIVTVVNVPDAPTANDDSYTVIVDSVGDELDVLDNDTSAPDPAEVLTVTSVTATAEGGSVQIVNSGSQLVYSPPAGFSGEDTFSYTITDEDGLTDDAIVTLSISDYLPGGLSGLVYIDADADGVFDSDELVLGGIQVTLSGTDVDGNDVSAQMHTDLSGRYEFSDLKAGDYTVTQTQPRYLVDGGFVGASPDITFDSNSFSVTLGYGESIGEANFTEKGREAQSLSLLDFFNKPAEPTMVASFGNEIAESWIAIGPEWSAYDDTQVTWDGISHSLVIDVTDVDGDTQRGVLSWESDNDLRHVAGHEDTPLIVLADNPQDANFTVVVDADDTGDNGDDDSGDGDDGSELNQVPEFMLVDTNTTSDSFNTSVSPRDLNGNISVYYFGLATCNYCSNQFGYLDTLQTELDTDFGDLGVEIIGVNLAGRESGNSSFTSGRDIPWLQDVDADNDGDSDVWVEWGAQLRDVMIVDEQNQLVETINLTLYDLADTSNYDSLRDKIIGADSGEGELTLESDWRAGSEIEETIDTLAQFFNR